MQGTQQALCILNEYGKSMAWVWLECVLAVLMMVVGANGVKAQTVDYSGTYYIGSYGKDDQNHIGYTVGSTETNYYLCPTEDWIYYEYKNNKDDYTLTPNDQPFITSYQVKSTSKEYDATKAEWVITKHSTLEYYYIQQRKTGKYLVFNGQINTSKSANRIRVHLEGGDESYEPGENALFEITTNPANSYLNGAYLFHPKKAGAGYYLNISEGNQDALIGTNVKTDGPTYSDFTKFVGGTLGQWNEANNTSSYRFEDIIPAPIITQTDDNIITITYSGSETVILYYTTNGDKPDPANAGGSNPTQIYEVGTTTITMSNPVTTVRAIAVKTAGTGESLDTYSRCVTLTTQRYIGSDYSYMFQNVECIDFYMIPGDVKNKNTEVNTSSLFRSTMEWKFTNAGSVDGVQYYYIINGHTGDYLYHTIVNIGKDCAVYMKTSREFGDATDKTGYMFTLVQGYSDDEKNNPDGFHIVPKSQISASNYCIYKGGWDNTTPPTLANSKDAVMKGSNNARRPEQKHTRWNIITYAAPGNVLPTSLVTSDESNPSLFKFENVGTLGQYMSSPATGNVGTATLGNDALAWYIKEADCSDSERKYYYIVHQSGKYLKFNQTIASPVTNMGDKADVLSLLDYDNSESDRYQFVFAKSTVDGAYYIVPKGLEEASKNNYYALYLNGSQIKSNKNRQSDSYKWKLVPFCYNPVFVESAGNITVTCATTGTEIHYTNDGTEPDETSTTYSSTNWASSDQVCIKAIGVIKDGSDVVSTSEVVTLLNKPTVTLEGGQVYDGQQKIPEVKSVSVGTTEAPKAPATYTIAYTNNINAGENTAYVTITDNDSNDRWYIWNVPNTYFTIEKKMLTVTADNKIVEYGHPAPEYTVTITEFENGEGVSVLATIPTATCTDYTTTSNVGSTYDIVPSGGVDENYDFTYVNGTLTVAAAFVTLTANSGTVTYNGTEQTVTGFTYNVDGQTLNFPGVSASGSGTNAGTHNVTFTGVTLNLTTDNTGQYVVTNIVDGTLTINPTEAIVTADNKTKTYGDTDPELTVTVTGMVNSESTDLISYSISRATGNNVGDYVITPTGETTQGNYTVNYETGTLTINQKELTITAQDKNITYGEVPNNSVTYSGFITGENENTTGVFNGTLVYSYNSQADGQGTSYTTTIPAGTRYIIPSGLTATNYAITYIAGELTVNVKSIGDGSIASGFTLSFGEGGATVLKDGETLLYTTTDYTIGNETTSLSGRYSEKTVSGTGNYTGSFSIRNANVNFQTDDNQVEWSATFVAEKSGDTDIGHALPEGIRAYIITKIIDGWAIPEQLDYIPEGIPVLLISNKESGGFLVENANPDDVTLITREGSGNQKDANMLEMVKTGMAGYVTDSESPNYKKAHFNLKTIYLLSYNEFVHNMDGYLSDGKVFLNPNHPTDPSSATAAPSPAPMRMRINWDIVNGIKDIPNKGNAEKWNSGQWYGLDGRLLNGTPTQKGLYFHNGKKVIIKEDL